MAGSASASPAVLTVDGLDRLIAVLLERGWHVLGPTVRDGAIVPAPIRGIHDLPAGVGDEQRPARYRLRGRDDEAFFGFAAPATSWKPVLFPSRQLLWKGTRRPDGFDTSEPDEPPPPRALVGVRSCDLAAIGVQDRVLTQRWGGRPAADVHYAAGRGAVFVVAVTCGTPAATCFCTSMGTGPAPSGAYDLALTELLDDDGHRFLVEVGSDAGSEVLAEVPTEEAADSDREAADAVVAAAVGAIDRQVRTEGLSALLDAEVEHPLWDEVASRCLACGNCTAVCPTCFCTSVQDVTDLSGQETERWREWDSCFSAGFSYVHGGPVRSSTKSRYRQWMSHKLGTWTAQFDTSGCVGCGRCLTWCPVGIDITAEAAALQSTARTSANRRKA
jgi:sulfhydrogenase subunit beta (sulfur reductase)